MKEIDNDVIPGEDKIEKPEKKTQEERDNDDEDFSVSSNKRIRSRGSRQGDKSLGKKKSRNFRKLRFDVRPR